MKQFIKTLTLIIFFAYITACNTTEPPINNNTLTLKLEDVSCTEAWLQFTSTGLQLPNTLTLYVDDKVKETINLSTEDTLLYVDSLLPNQTYKIAAAMEQSNNASNELSITTMDTTSHNFTWQTWTFGGIAGSSTLYDVAIIDENDIWAVGEIYMLDSLGNPDPNAYNAVHWNGSEWKLLRLKFYTFCGQSSTGFYPTKSILAFSNNDIWITSGSQITHFDGLHQLSTDCIPVSVNRLWGTDDDNIYAVGVTGNIAHYQNGVWSKIESGTTTSIKDIYGSISRDSSTFILCAVTNIASAGDRKILRINDGIVNDFLWDTGRRVQSVWFKNDFIIYACGGGVFSLKKNNYWKEAAEIPLYYTEEIRGDDVNNIMAVGDFGLLAHFNGLNWKVFNEPLADIYYSCSVKSNIITAVGTKNGKAFIALSNK